MPRKVLYAEKTEAQLKQWAAKLEELRRKVEKGSAEAEADLLSALAEVRIREAAIREVMKEVRAAGGESWRDAKAGLEAAWVDVKATYEKAKKSLGMAPAKPMRKPIAKAKAKARATTKKVRANLRVATARARKTARAAR